MSNQLLYMYNGNLGIQAHGLGPWEAQAPEGLTELLELRKYDWSPGPLSRPRVRAWGLYLRCSYAWCRCVPFTVQPASPDVTPDAGLFMGAGQEGDTSTRQHSPWLAPPRVPGPRDRFQSQGRFNCGWTPVSKQIVQKQQTYRREGVVISSIKYSTHPDIRSLLLPLIGWPTLVPIWFFKITRNNHGTRAQACMGTNTHASLSYCDTCMKNEN